MGACTALRSDDVITSTHRGHGHLIAKGGEPKYMMAELAARSTGYCGGKGGSLHMTDFDLGILGANGIVAVGIPMASGAALVESVKKTNRALIVHEAHRRAGPGAEIAALLAEEAIGYLDAPIVRVATKNVPFPYHPELEKFILPETDDIVEAVKGVVNYTF